MFLTRCHRILNEVAAAEAELSNASGTPRGRLRISAPQLTELVMPAIHSFMHAYPEIDVDLDLSDRMVDIIEEGFDVVIRTGDQADSRLASRKIGTSRRVLAASSVYLDRHGVADDLARGDMRKVLDEFIDDPVTFWAVWPTSRHSSPKLRAFVDHVRTKLLPP